jgi:hypothetical protein
MNHVSRIFQEDAAEVAMMRLNHPRAATANTQTYHGGSASSRWGTR